MSRSLLHHAAVWFGGAGITILTLAEPSLAQDEAPPAEPLPQEAPPVETAPVEPPRVEAPPVEPDPTQAPASSLGDAPAPLAAVEPRPPLEVTVVGAALPRVPGSLQVIGNKQLERFRYDDPNAIVQQVPGVYVRQEDGVGLRPNIGIRGANADRSKKITLMEDGILFGPAPYSASAAYYFPLMSRMYQVRVVKGPSAIMYGPHTVGGAVDFITRPIPASASGFLDLGIGEYGYNKLHGHVGASTEQLGFLLEGVHLHDDGFKHLPSEADTGSTRNDWMLKLSYDLDPQGTTRNELGLKLAYADEASNETYLGLSDADLRDDPYRRYAASALDRMESHRTSLVLSHNFALHELGLELKTHAYRHDYARIWRKVNRLRGAEISGVLADTEDPTNAAYYAVLTGQEDSATGGDVILIGPNDRTFVNQGIQSVGQLDLRTGGLSQRIEAGARLHYDSIERRHSEDGFLMIEGQLVPEGTPEVITAANEMKTTALALHVSDAVSWRGLTVTPGVRLELIWTDVDDHLAQRSNDAALQAIMPGIGVFYDITDTLGALGGVYRGFSPPAPSASSDAEPEYSVNYELGARFHPGRSRAELIGFYNDYSNLTDVCTLASGCLTDDLDRQFDAGKARIMGLEAFTSHELVLGGVSVPLGFSYTLTHGEFRNTFQSQDPIYGDVESGDEIPYIPRHQLNASFGAETEQLGLIFGLGYVSKMRERAGSGPRDPALSTDEQLWLDAGMRARVLSWLALYGNLRNAFGSQDIVSRRPYGARPNAPRWLQLGAELRF
jgi:Fe(3+) dicitrate transport protein